MIHFDIKVIQIYNQGIMKKLLITALIITVCVLSACSKKDAEVPEAAANAPTVAGETSKANKEAETLGAPSTTAASENTTPEYTLPETKAVSELSDDILKKLTSAKWEETTQHISIMRLDKDGNGEFENADLGFEWSFDDNMVTIVIGGRADVEPIFLRFTENDGKKILRQTNGDAIFEQQ